MRWRVFLFLIFLLGFFSSYALEVSEVMYCPAFDENYNEYVEIYNNGDAAIDVTLLTLCGDALIADSSSMLEPGDYGLIIDGGTGSQVLENFDVQTSKIFAVDSSSICSRLSNSGKELVFAFEGGDVLEFFYEGICEKGQSYYAGNCGEPTPGWAADSFSIEPISELDEEVAEEELSATDNFQDTAAAPEYAQPSTLPITAELVSESEPDEVPDDEPAIYCSRNYKIEFYALLVFLGLSIFMNIVLIIVKSS